MPETSDNDAAPRPPVRPPPPGTPLGLDYFVPGGPERRHSPSAELGIAIVVIGWVPFACGVVNLMVAANSYSPTITGSHHGGAIAFFAVGIMATAVGLLRLATIRHAGGLLFAVVVLAVQLAIVTCLGLSTVHAP